MQIKTWDIISHWSEWPSSKSLQTINAGEGVEERELSCTVGGNANWYSHEGEHRGDSLKNWKLNCHECVCLVTQLYPTLCHPMDCSTPAFPVQGILQARILEWVAIPSSRGSSQFKDWTQVSHITGGIFTIWATREAEVGSLSLLQEIFPTQESNQGLLHCRQILYWLSYQGCPRTAIWPSNPTAGHTPQRKQNWKRYMYPGVHCSTIYNS